MAQTDLQRPDKTRLFNDIQRIGDEIYRHLTSWESARAFLAMIETSDLTTIGVNDPAVIADMVDLRQVVTEFTTLFEGGAVTPIKSPKEVVNKIRRMMPI